MRLKSIYVIRLFLFLIFVFVVYHFGVFNSQNITDVAIPAHLTLIDWHNYSLIESQKHRTGFGEHGRPVILTEEEKALSEKLFRENGFSSVVSDKISLERANPDLRHPDCKTKLYSAQLPKVSIIIPVFEEHWTTLLRTITSVIIQSPPNLIKEIILVDDGSFKSFLKQPLDDYVKNNYPNGFVVVIHHPKRVGLIKARLTGAKLATGDVLVFLDSHVEATTNWLPPLLHPIAADYRTVVCPFIDVIEMNSFEYRAQDDGRRGAFDWILNYKRLDRLPSDASHPSDPFDSPIMAGGLFAISAKWFWELGGYDPGLAIWGAEQYELSFKIWMCGGTMIDAPCSHVGHIYRGSVNFPSSGVDDFLSKNYRRLIDVWMDEYGEHVLKRRPHLRSVNPGDLTEQHALRKRLNCKSFHWFMTHVAFDLTKRYPPDDPMPIAIGNLRTGDSSQSCLAANGKKISIAACDDYSYLSNFTFSWRDDISVTGSDYCFDVQSSNPPASIDLIGCHGDKGNQEWSIVFTKGFDRNPIKLKHKNHNLCLQADPESRTVIMNTCSSSPNQVWIWDTLQRKRALENHAEMHIEP